MSESQWKQFVQLFSEKNPHLTKKQVLQYAKKPFRQLKKYFSQRGGATVDQNIEYLLGVANPNQNEMPDALGCAVEPAGSAVPAVLTKFNTGRTFVEVNGVSLDDPNEKNQVDDLMKLSHGEGYRMSNAHLLYIFQHKYVWGLCKEFYKQNGDGIDDDACRTLVARIIRNSQYLRKLGVIYIRFKIIAEYQTARNKLFTGPSINTLTDNLQTVFLLFINIILSYKPEHIVIFSDDTILTDLHNLRSCDMVRRIFGFYRNKETSFWWGITSMGNWIQSIITNRAQYIGLLYDYAITKLYSFRENLLRHGTSKSEEASPYDPEESEYFIKKDSIRDRIPPPAPKKALISYDLKSAIVQYLRNEQQDTTQRNDTELIKHLKKIYASKKGIMGYIFERQKSELEAELDKLLE